MLSQKEETVLVLAKYVKATAEKWNNNNKSLNPLNAANEKEKKSLTLIWMWQVMLPNKMNNSTN